MATLSLFNSGEVRREGFRGCQVDSIQERLAAASKARQDEADGKNAALTPNMCETATPEQADAMPYDLYREGYYYYGRDAAHEQHLQLHGVEPHETCRMGCAKGPSSSTCRCL